MTATLIDYLPSKRQVQRTASEFAVSLAVELLVVGVVRRVRRGRGKEQPHEPHQHRFLRAVVAEAAAEGATGLSTQRRRMMFQLERRLDDEMSTARHHGGAS